MNKTHLMCVPNTILNILRRIATTAKNFLHSTLTFIKAMLSLIPRHLHLLSYRLVLIFVLIVSITISVLLWTEVIGPGVPLKRSLVKNVISEGFDDWKESPSTKKPVHNTDIPGEDTTRPNPALRLESELSVEAPQGLFQETQLRVNPIGMPTLTWRVSDSFIEDATNCRLPEKIVMSVRFVGLEEEIEPLGTFRTVFALVKVPVDEKTFIPDPMPISAGIVTVASESFRIANCYLLRAGVSYSYRGGNASYSYSTGSNNDAKPVFYDEQVIVAYDVVREDSPSGTSYTPYSTGQGCGRSEDLGGGWWNWPDLLSPTHIEPAVIPLVWVVSDDKEFFYAYFPVEQTPDPAGQPLRFTIPPGLSRVSLVYTAQATYNQRIYEAQEQGPSLGLFLPYLERTSFEWQKTAFALAVLFLGISVFLQLVKSYLTGTR